MWGVWGGVAARNMHGTRYAARCLLIDRRALCARAECPRANHEDGKMRAIMLI